MPTRRALVDVPNAISRGVVARPSRTSAPSLKTASRGLRLTPRPRVGRTAWQAPDAPEKNRPHRPWSRRSAVLPQKKKPSTLEKAKQCAADQLGLTALGGALAGAGANILGTRGKFQVQRLEHRWLVGQQAPFSET